MVQEPPDKPLDLAKGVRLPYYTRVAHMGMMLEKMRRQNRMAERIQQFAVTRDVNDLKTPAEEQDMGVNIGNENHYHIYQNSDDHSVLPEPTPSPVPTPPAVEPATPEPPLWGAKKLNWWQKGLIGVGALGSGIGIAAIANEYYHGHPKPPAVVDTDTDNITEVDFPD